MLNFINWCPARMKKCCLHPVTWPTCEQLASSHNALGRLGPSGCCCCCFPSLCSARRLSKNDNSQRPCEIKFGRLLSACYQAFMVPFPAGTWPLGGARENCMGLSQPACEKSLLSFLCAWTLAKGKMSRNALGYLRNEPFFGVRTK